MTDNSIIDIRIARVEDYWILGLYKENEKEPYEWKVYGELNLIMMDLHMIVDDLKTKPQTFEVDILDLLNMKREEDE